MARLLVPILLSAVLGSISLASGSRWIGCTPEVGQQIISLNETLLPRANIVASSQRSINPDDDLVDYGSVTQTTWCSDISSSNDLSPTIDISFTEPVLITGFISGGYNYGSGNVEYVNNFTVEYFSSLEGSGDPMDFFVPAINSYFPVYSPPVVVETLHLSVHGYVLYIGDICWSLALLGCPISEAIQTPTVSTVGVVSPDPTSTSSGGVPSSSPAVLELSSSTPILELSPSPSVVEPSSTPSGGETEPSSSKETVVEKDFMVLAIVLPIALVNILIVFVIVAVGVCICVRHKKESWRPRERSDTLKVLDNSGLYLLASHNAGEGIRKERADTIHHATNLLYESSGDQTYEMIGKGTEDTGSDDMETNPIYNDPLKYQQSGGARPIETYSMTATGNTAEYSYPTVNISAVGVGKSNPAGVQTLPNESYNAQVANDTEYAYPTVNVSAVDAGGNNSANVYEETPH